MPSTFSGLNIASSGLQANQTALNVTGHNIANANNPDYKRQEAVMGAKTPFAGQTNFVGAGALGAGVEITTVRRMQDNFVQGQIWNANQSLGQYQAGKQALDQVVSIIGEPSDNGLSSDLDKFWNGWQDLSLHPDDMASRDSMVEFGSSVAGHLNQMYTQIEGVQNQQDSSIRGQVDNINQLATQLATLNGQISASAGSGNAPNDLLDQRDAVITQLSTIVGVQVHGDGGAGDVISVGGHALVQGDKVSELTTGTDASGHATVQWKEDGSAATIQGGTLGGTLTLVHDTIPGYLASLDAVAQNLMSGVNALHKGGTGLDGQTGRDFFTGTGARDIKVNPDLANNPRLIAASGTGATGDGSVALSIANVKNQAVSNGSTVGEVYSQFVSKTASDASNATNQVEVQSQVQSQLTLQQQSVSGVSLDEEMSNMVRFQQSYNANARVFSTMNQMLGTLIDEIGSGR